MYPKIRLIQKITRLFAACLLLSYAQPGLAQSEAQILNELNELVKAKQYAEAYALADKHVMDYGGEPAFDYLMGLAAINTKSYEEAVFAFERAVINKPKWDQARFQLAKGYYYIDNLAASRSELVRLKDNSKDPALVTVTEQFITQVDNALIARKRKFKQVVAVSYSHDTNINSGTTIDEIFIPQLGDDILLSTESKETGDNAFNLSYMAQYQEPLTQNRLLIGQLSLFNIDYENTPAFEVSMLDASLKFQDVLGDFTYQVGVFFRPMTLNKAHYRDQYGYSTNWTLPINNNWSANWQVGFGKIDSRISSAQDLRDVFTTMTASYRSGRLQQVFSLNHTDIRSVESNTKHNSYHFYKLGSQSTYIVTPSQQVVLNLQWQKLNYDVIHQVFGKVRDEDVLNTSIGWRYIMNDWMMLQASYRYSDKTSNIPIYAYDREEFSLGLTMQF